MNDPRDYKLEVGSLSPRGESLGVSGESLSSGNRPFLSVLFSCCGVYQRIYRHPDGTQYTGACPRCGKPVRFVVGQRGTTARFFVVQ